MLTSQAHTAGWWYVYFACRGAEDATQDRDEDEKEGKGTQEAPQSGILLSRHTSTVSD